MIIARLAAKTSRPRLMNMDFYGDGGQPPTSQNPTFVPPSSKEDIRKRLTLDLNSPRMKKPRFDVLLSSPDLNMLKLPSPELERLIMQQNGLLCTSTPTPSQFLYPNPRTVTQEQEIYARGFVDALAELHQNESHNVGPSASTASTVSTTSSTTTTTSAGEPQPPDYHPSVSAHHLHQQPAQQHAFGQGLQIPVKEEPQTCGASLSSSPPMSPIDMEDQERIKLERKRQRNRIAASKCRRRKLERIARLEDKVKQLKGENGELASVVIKLRQQVCGLKEQVMEHVQCGCQIMITTQF